MPERRLLWPLLAYGALSLVAFTRLGESSRTDARVREEDARETEGATRFRPAGNRGIVDRARARRRALPRPQDLRRQHEKGRGREATAPWDIPLTGWRDILWRVHAKINDSRLMAVAAGVVFFVILALFPALTALVSLHGLFADSSVIDQQESGLSNILPGGAVDVLHEELTRLAATKNSGLSAGFVLGLLFALWSANSGMKAIIDALNVAYGEKEKRSFIPPDVESLVMTIVALASMMLAIGAVVVAPIVLGHLGFGASPAP